jgi:hypothetical protein
MPRVSHIAPTLSLPGFTGYPSSNNRQTAYGDGKNRPSPYGDLSLDIITPPTIVQPRLTTGRVLSAGATPMSDVFDYSRRRESPGKFPQSIPSSQSGFASNAETAIFPNPDPFPVMIGMLDAQITAMKQDEATRAATISGLGLPADRREIVERLKSPAELYFEGERKKADAIKIERLQVAGYTDQEIADFTAENRRAGMAAAAVREEPEEALYGAIARLQGGMPQTGTNAVGIGAFSAARERADGPAETTAEMLSAAMSAMGTGGSVASLLQGAADPRASASYAARREAAAAGDPFIGRRSGVRDVLRMTAARADKGIAAARGEAPSDTFDIAQLMGIASGGGGARRGGAESAMGGGGGAAAGGLATIAERSLDRAEVGGGLSKSKQAKQKAIIRARMGLPARGPIGGAAAESYRKALRDAGL